MSTLTAPRPQVKSRPPAAGSCRWVFRPGSAGFGPSDGVLEINGTPYVVRLHGDDPRRDPQGATLTKGDGTQYTVDLSTGECDCPDHQYRNRQCKHHRATVAALKAIS